MLRSLLLAAAATLLWGAAAPAQTHVSHPCSDRPGRCVTARFEEAEIRDVVAAFARLSGHSIVVAPAVTGTVSAEIRDQPWDHALDVLLRAHGFAAREIHPGILQVDLAGRGEDAVVEPLTTAVFRINYVPAQELAPALASVLSERGSVAVSPSTNSLVVTDTVSGVERAAALLGKPLPR